MNELYLNYAMVPRSGQYCIMLELEQTIPLRKTIGIAIGLCAHLSD